MEVSETGCANWNCLGLNPMLESYDKQGNCSGVVKEMVSIGNCKGLWTWFRGKKNEEQFITLNQGQPRLAKQANTPCSKCVLV